MNELVRIAPIVAAGHPGAEASRSWEGGEYIVYAVG